jgi:choline dehydrogenase-like flavoprotein
MSSLPDPIREGLQRGWKVHGGPHAPLPAQITCDVAIVGSGAGAGITAELLTAAGLNVVIVEEGPLRSSSDFRQLESDAYAQLYQESNGRKTADKAIAILQGRSVGGSTTVNWTSSFRTPAATLQYWADRFALPDMSEQAMSPWFMQAEQRLNIGPWLVPPNANNEKLKIGAARLGITAAAILRNVKGCWNLGSCGLGCPTNAKQSMLVTTIPAALDRGATLLVQTQAVALELQGSRVQGLRCRPVALNGTPGNGETRIVARHVVVAGGAINSPALLMRSKAPDPHGRLGTRTFLHPVVATTAKFDERIEAWNGAPQTIYTDHFLETQPIDGPMGYKIEAPPLHPLIGSIAMSGIGAEQAEEMKLFPHTQALLALLRDGFHEQSTGGSVKLRGDGSPVLDYPITPFVWDGARRALLSMAEIQFAAGARVVSARHEQATYTGTWREAKAQIESLPMAPYKTRVFSAHVMGGCGMAGRAELGVVRPDGRHWQLENLSVHDGSLFPTSIGANPQLSIYGLVNKLATRLARDLAGRDVTLAAPTPA